jgi:hypothetical protein
MSELNGKGRNVVLGLLWLVVLSSCAVFNEDNRRLLNVLDDAVAPQSTAAQIALAPPGIVVGSVALGVDAVVVHPIAVIPKAWDDVQELYWKPREYTAIREALLIVPLAVLTPPTFVADWIGRSLFDID